MRQSRGLLCFLVLLACTSSPGPSDAQEALLDAQTLEKRSQSHVPIPLVVQDPRAAQAMLEERLRNAQALAGLQKLAEDILKNPDRYGLDKELERYRREGFPPIGRGLPGLQDKRLRELVDKVLEQHGQQPIPHLDLKPDQLKAWKNLLKPAQPSELPKATVPPVENGQGKPPELPGPKDTQQPTRPLPEDIPAPRMSNGALPNASPSQGGGSVSQETLNRWAEWFQNSPTVRNSPALQGAIRDLKRGLLSGFQPDKMSAKWLENLPRMDRWAPLEGWRLSERFQTARSWLPRLPAVEGGSLLRETGSWRLPRIDAPSPSTAAGGLEVLAWTILFVAFGLTVWRILAWRKAALERSTEQWRLGPWPVRPGAITTRQELIQAFEYLSLLLLGRAALTWNHVAIAAQIAEQESSGDAERRQAARELALLYEQARYAPSAGPLPAADLAAARRDLCLLAGARAS